MWTFEKEKRHLVQRVKDSKKNQEQAREKLKTIMEAPGVAEFQGGSLEQSYETLNSEYEQAQARADQLPLIPASNDLFSELQKEIDQLGNTKPAARCFVILKNAKRYL